MRSATAARIGDGFSDTLRSPAASFWRSSENSALAKTQPVSPSVTRSRWQPTASLRLNLNYTRLDSREGDAGDSAREIRRPRNTANVFADWRSGPYTIGASFAYVGRRTDRDFDLFPAPTVTLDDYLLGGLRLAYRLLPQVEAFARVENGFDADYQDVFGYGQPGRSVHAGLRVALGR